MTDSTDRRIKPNPDILDAMELWQLRAFEQGDEATGTMLSDIRDGYQAGYVGHGNASVAIASARVRLRPFADWTGADQ